MVEEAGGKKKDIVLTGKLEEEVERSGPFEEEIRVDTISWWRMCN